MTVVIGEVLWKSDWKSTRPLAAGLCCSRQASPPPRTPPDCGTSSVSDSGSGCIKTLKIAVWNRTEGSNGLRSITNLDDVVDLAEQYSARPAQIVDTNSRMAPIEQASLFNEFDILITTHGSHMANSVFVKPHAVVIELMSVHLDLNLCRCGQSWARAYIHSLGHLPIVPGTGAVDETLKGLMCRCTHDANYGCPVQEYKAVDILANLTRLREDLELAISIRCMCIRKSVYLPCSDPNGDWRATEAIIYSD